MKHRNIVTKRQVRLSFTLVRPRSTEDFREACSQWFCAGARLPSISQTELRSMFHHEPDGRPAQHLSSFRFEARGNWGHIFAVGEQAGSLLERIGKEVIRAPDPKPWLCRPILSEQEIQMNESDEPVVYSVSNLVICRDAQQHKMWMGSSETAKQEHVQDVLQRGLSRQLQILGVTFDVPAPAVQTISHERAVPKLHSMPQANVFVRVASVLFGVPLDLRGHWAAGALVNRGYGRIDSL